MNRSWRQTTPLCQTLKTVGPGHLARRGRFSHSIWNRKLITTLRPDPSQPRSPASAMSLAEQCSTQSSACSASTDADDGTVKVVSDQAHGKSVTIIGAGVLGLSTASILQERYPGLTITVVAAEFPTPPPLSPAHAFSTSPVGVSAPPNRPSADYASMWAGAHYRPIPRSTRQLEDESYLALRTAVTFKRIAAEHPSDSGVAIVPAAEYLEQSPTQPEVLETARRLKTGEVYAGEKDEFRVLSREELEALPSRNPDPSRAQFDGERGEKPVWGCSYQSYVVNVHVYCRWLLKRLVANGAHTLEKRLERVEDAFGITTTSGRHDSTDAPVKGKDGRKIVINCSGRNFDTDPLVRVIRGQTVLVRNEYHATVTRQNSDGSWSFLIPRPLGGGTIVGGTKEVGDMSTDPRPDDRRKLLENSVCCFPDFVDDVSKFEVVMDNVGRRPWREGGLRVEVEDVGDGRMVVHGYGAGGRGYELSWGVAEDIVGLFEKCLNQS